MLGNILSGLRVIDLTQNVAGPFCTQILGDMGAEVIKIERPGSGDDIRLWMPPAIGGESSTFLALNRNKKSVCVDVSTAEGSALVRKLATTADVFVHSMRPGSAEARGLGYDDLAALNPKLVYCAISAFGEIGPLAALPGYDPLMQAFTGIMSVTGNEGEPPVRVSVSLIDLGTGLWSALGAVAGLFDRMKTGRGTKVHASLLETGLSWMTVFIGRLRRHRFAAAQTWFRHVDDRALRSVPFRGRPCLHRRRERPIVQTGLRGFGLPHTGERQTLPHQYRSRDRAHDLARRTRDRHRDDPDGPNRRSAAACRRTLQ